MPDFRAILPFNFVNGTTADANEMNANLYELRDKHNNSLSGSAGHTHSGTDGDGPKLGASGLDLTANYAWTGQHSWANTTLFSTATANANRFHGLGDAYGGASTILSVTTDALPSNNFYYLKCIADYNGTPFTAFGIGAGGSTFIASGSDLYLDGGNDTSWRESSANVMTAKTGGTDRVSISSSGVLMENIDPPTANYANRNGIVKGWIRATTGPGAGAITVLDSYNVSSATETGTGATLKINWNTDFASANYVFSGVVFANDGGGTPWPQGIMTTLTQTSGILEIQAAIHDGTSDGDPAINAAEWYIMAIGDQ